MSGKATKLAVAVVTLVLRACAPIGVPLSYAAEPVVDPCTQTAFNLKLGSKFMCPGAWDAVRVTESLRLLVIENDLNLARDTLTAERAERASETTLATETWTAEHAARLACEASHTAPCVCPVLAWYESPGFLVPVGIVLGVGLSVVTVYALRAGE